MDHRTTRPDVHGHRGCRGLMPENTIPAFLKATELGADYLEMDVVVSADGEVIVSHDPWIDTRLCRTWDGASLDPALDTSLNIYQMTVKEIRDYDCGSLVDERFPDQRLQRARKPTLGEVVEAVEEHVTMHGLRTMDYNIEIKSRPEWYGIYQPEPAAYVETVLRAFEDLSLDDRVIIQSFDPAILEAMRAQDPSIELALLVDNEDGLEANLKKLSFIPEYYSPQFRLTNADLLDKVHDMDMGLLVWTVNEPEDLMDLLRMRVDGIITDHPDRLLHLIEQDKFIP